jgi:hypothetical protein
MVVSPRRHGDLWEIRYQLHTHIISVPVVSVRSVSHFGRPTAGHTPCGTSLRDGLFGLVVKSSWLLTQGPHVRFPTLPDFLSSSGSGMGSTQPLSG